MFYYSMAACYSNAQHNACTCLGYETPYPYIQCKLMGLPGVVCSRLLLVLPCNTRPRVIRTKTVHAD